MNVECYDGPLQGLKILKTPVHEDARGWFTEIGKSSQLASLGLPASWAQTNLSQSRKGVLRGLHFQKPPYEQGKLIKVLSGRVWDVALDLRSNSPTYGQWYGLELSAQEGSLLYIPPGFAHGFLSLEDETQILYFLTSEYQKDYESGVRWDDPRFNISWPLQGETPLVSEKDAGLPFWTPSEGGVM